MDSAYTDQYPQLQNPRHETRACMHMALAYEASKLGTCDRKQVGACLLSKHGDVIGIGWNGSGVGATHCNQVKPSHLLQAGHCTHAIHAEVNALLAAGRSGVSTLGSIMFLTLSPCWPCFQIMLNAGVETIVFGSCSYAWEDFEITAPLYCVRPVYLDMKWNNYKGDSDATKS